MDTSEHIAFTIRKQGYQTSLLLSSLLIPAHGMVLPTMGSPSHSNYPNPDNPALTGPDATSQVTLALVKLTLTVLAWQFYNEAHLFVC